MVLNHLTAAIKTFPTKMILTFLATHFDPQIMARYRDSLRRLSNEPFAMTWVIDLDRWVAHGIPYAMHDPPIHFWDNNMTPTKALDTIKAVYTQAFKAGIKYAQPTLCMCHSFSEDPCPVHQYQHLKQVLGAWFKSVITWNS